MSGMKTYKVQIARILGGQYTSGELTLSQISFIVNYTDIGEGYTSVTRRHAVECIHDISRYSQNTIYNNVKGQGIRLCNEPGQYLRVVFNLSSKYVIRFESVEEAQEVQDHIEKCIMME